MAVQLVVAIAVVLAGVGLALLVLTIARPLPRPPTGPSGARVVRISRESPPGPAPTLAAPVPDSPEVEMNRRMFLNRTMLLSLSVFGVAFGGGSLAMLWSNKTEGFGGRIRAGSLDEILRTISVDGRYYNAEGRFYFVTYPHTDDPDNPYVQAGAAKNGIMALYQKCAHLGCRVPFCPTSEWFECPCHGSQYNYAGERRAGPAPAGLWRFPIEFEGDVVVVDTSTPTAQPPLGTDTIRQPPAGGHCVGAAEGAG